MWYVFVRSQTMISSKNKRQMIITTHKLNVKLKSMDKLIVVFRLNKCHSEISFFFVPTFFWICRQITYLQFMTFLFGYLAICMFLRVQNALFAIIRILIQIVHAVMKHVAIVFDTQLKFSKCWQACEKLCR